MKLVRYGNPGKEKPGLIDANGQLRDLSSVVKDIGPDQLGDAALAKIAKVKTDMERDYWMTAEEAKKYGLVDQVLSKIAK